LAFFEKICGIPSPILLKANSELTTPNGAFAAKVPNRQKRSRNGDRSDEPVANLIRNHSRPHAFARCHDLFHTGKMP
jgi:hypothetical protein